MDHGCYIDIMFLLLLLIFMTKPTALCIVLPVAVSHTECVKYMLFVKSTT